jgi:tetrahydromethanopterin S-methyltransferase subunit F|tara:strand:- start:368 stop:553 length:186 start_codon:yes stop_codon:yes gene_type:complete
MDKSLEDLIEDAADRIVNGGIYRDGRNRRLNSGFNSERSNLNAMVTTLLINAITRMREDQL